MLPLRRLAVASGLRRGRGRGLAGLASGVPREAADAVVVGAGVVGLAVARALAMAGREVLVVEAAPSFGTGTSSRNSEVIHAGIYYPPRSLKASLCVRGKELLYKYCAERGIPHKRLGKLIVATGVAEIAKLDMLLTNAKENGVNDLRMMEQSQAMEMEPELRCLKALLSPSTGIVDSHSFMLSLLADAENLGATISYNTTVVDGNVGYDGLELHISESKELQNYSSEAHVSPQLTLLPKLLINSAGLSAVPLAKRFHGLNQACMPTAYYARGCYFTLSQSKSPFSCLIYPLPEDGGIGVHVTLDLNGLVRFGPDVEWINGGMDPMSCFLNRYADWGERLPHRPAQDNAFAVARFYQRGGSLQNYYMFFGGTNFERTAGGPLQITSYDYDAPITEYGILRQPKWGHLKDLHAAIKLCEPALTAVDGSPQYVKLGPMQEAHIYSNKKVHTNGSISGNVHICSAFLANIDEHKYVSVWIFGKSYNLPPWSVSILPDCENVAFNTAMVGTQTSVFSIESGSPSYSSRQKPSVVSLDGKSPYLSSTWWTSKEPIGTWGDDSFSAEGILEHLNVTKDVSDYLWYTTRINISDEDVAFWSSKGVLPSLNIDQIRDVACVFVNGELAGSKVGKWVSFNQPVQLVQGVNELILLSEIVGLQNYGAFLEKDGAGFRGQVKLTGLPSGDIDLTSSLWTYQVGLKGEFSMIYSPEKQGCSEWSGMQKDDIQSPFTWYKTMFDAPEGTDPVAIGLGSMGKGQAWVNGRHIGRYWSLLAPESGCPSSCNYAGAYSDSKCRSNCGMPTQSWYHIPREWLQESSNLLVLFEETGGDPYQISLEVHYTKTVCSRISENYYPPLSAWSCAANGRASVNTVAPELHLQCDDGHVISKITFASYGTPSGGCQNNSIGKCHASNTQDLVTETCVGKGKCAISVSNDVFGDPCPRVVKDLAVEAECSTPSATKELRDDM